MTVTEGAGPPAPPKPMTEAEFRGLYDRLHAQPPWGLADRRAALGGQDDG